MANGTRALDSTLACRLLKLDSMSARAVNDTAIGPMNRRSTSVATEELVETLAICSGGST